jgi:hypothetical protein
LVINAHEDHPKILGATSSFTSIMTMNRKSLFIICFAIIVLACQQRAAMALIPSEEMSSSSQLLYVTRLSDGTVERHYANGTVMHDYAVTMQFHTVETWTMAATTSTIIVEPKPPDTPDDDSNPFNHTELIYSFLVVIGAGTILSVWAKQKKSCRLPAPLGRANVGRQ